MKKLFVFDLDFTLWDTGGVWCDCTTPPYRKAKGKIVDANNREMKLYADTPFILAHLKQNGHPLAIASRTSRPEWAKELLQLFNIDHYFDFKEIYPSSKIKHLSNIQKDSGYAFGDMVFFDDEYRNIEDAQRLGVNAEFVKNGINQTIVASHL